MVAMVAVVLEATAAPEAMAVAQGAMAALEAMAAAQLAMVVLEAMAALEIMAVSLTNLKGATVSRAILPLEVKDLGGTATTTGASPMTGMRKSRMTIIRA
jgi:hypothetical protein